MRERLACIAILLALAAVFLLWAFWPTISGANMRGHPVCNDAVCVRR